MLTIYDAMAYIISPCVPPNPRREFLITYRGSNYYEQVQADKVDMSLVRPLMGSKIVGYKNGVSQGVMYENVTGGKYYPAASLYMGAKVKLNLGPDFRYPPDDLELATRLPEAAEAEVQAAIAGGNSESDVMKLRIDKQHEAAAARANTSCYNPLCDAVHHHNAELTIADCVTKVEKGILAMAKIEAEAAKAANIAAAADSAHTVLA